MKPEKYYAKITPLHGQINAVIYQEREPIIKITPVKCELIVMHKWFGNNFNKAPRRKDYKKAIEWLNIQCDLINNNICSDIEKLYINQN